MIKQEGGEHGWRFCQHVTDTARYVKPEAIHIAEHWPPEQAVVAPTGQGGAGFDALQTDGLREAIRSAIRQVSAGAAAFVDMDRIARELASPLLADPWRQSSASKITTWSTGDATTGFPVLPTVPTSVPDMSEADLEWPRGSC